MGNLKHLKLVIDPNITEEQLDKDMWKGTKYEGMSFNRESDWTNFDQTYASPVFSFENGDRVVIDRHGNIKVL